MGILNVKIDSIGATGQVPKFIYIETNDTYAEVTTPGYLNQLVLQGYRFQDTDLAVITTKLTPTSKSSAVGLFDINISPAGITLVSASGSISGAQNVGTGASFFKTVQGSDLIFKTLVAGPNVTLTQNANDVTITTGKPFSTLEDYNTGSANGPINGSWQHLGGFNLQAGIGNVLLQSDTGSITLKAPNAGQSAIVEASLFTATIGNQISLNAGAQMFLTSGGPLTISATNPSTGEITLNSPKLSASTSLTSAVTSNVLYYNTGTGAITQGLAPGGGSDWNLTGTNSGANLKLGTNSANGWEYVANGLTFCTVSAVGLSTWSGGASFTGSFNVNSPSAFIQSIGNLNLWASANINIFAGSGFSVEIGGVLVLKTVPADVTPQLLYWNPITFQVTQGPAPSSSGWNLTGTNSGAGLEFGTNTTDGWQFVVNSVPFLTVDNGGISTWTGDIDFTGLFSITSPTTINLNTTTDINLNATTRVQISGDLFLTNPSAGSDLNVLYYNTVSGLVSHAVAPVAFNPASNWTTTGEWLNQNDWTFESGFVVNNGNNIAAIISTSAVPINISNIVGGVVAQGNIATLNATTGDASVIADLGNIAITSSTGQVSITAEGAVGVISQNAVIDCVGQISLQSDLEVRISPTDLFIESLPVLSTNFALCYNPITFRVTQAQLAFQPVQNFVDITAPGTYTPDPNTTYLVNSTGVIFLLPASIPTNAQMEFVGQNNNFVINANGGQSIRSISTVGVTLTTLSIWNSFVIKCTDVNTTFQVTQLMGNINLT